MKAWLSSPVYNHNRIKPYCDFDLLCSTHHQPSKDGNEAKHNHVTCPYHFCIGEYITRSAYHTHRLRQLGQGVVLIVVLGYNRLCAASAPFAWPEYPKSGDNFIISDAHFFRNPFLATFRAGFYITKSGLLEPFLRFQKVRRNGH